jgi:hypothetical protein
LPEQARLTQGGLTRAVFPIEISERPEWIEYAEIGPPTELTIWDQTDGRGRVDVLYRGVFVERIEIDRLWGLEGAIHVDPKFFRPKLNREGFVGDKLKTEVTPFLQSTHPLVLVRALESISNLLEQSTALSLDKAITLWLAVPRDAAYSGAAKLWDNRFRGIRAVRLLHGDSETEVSIQGLMALNAKRFVLAPENLGQTSAVVSQAVRVLRAKGEFILQGLERDRSFLGSASLVSTSTSWLLLHAFKSELPEIVLIDTIAETVVTQEDVADVFDTKPAVRLVRLGTGAAPFVTIRDEIWINIDNESGRKIVEEVCKRNEGYVGLWTACMLYGSQPGLDQVGALLRRTNVVSAKMGLVRRQFLRGQVN